MPIIWSALNYDFTCAKTHIHTPTDQRVFLTYGSPVCIAMRAILMPRVVLFLSVLSICENPRGIYEHSLITVSSIIINKDKGKNTIKKIKKRN